jgi:hypothetical protein
MAEKTAPPIRKPGKDLQMKPFAKTIGITLLTAATAIAPLTTTAQAGGHRDRFYSQHGNHPNIYKPRRYDGGYGHRVPRNHDNKDAIVLGIIGLGVGAIIGGAIANSHNNPPVVYRPAPDIRHYREPRVVHGGGSFEPWTKSWFRYCSNKYRSFNASTGTFRGYDGRDHFCVAR